MTDCTAPAFLFTLVGLISAYDDDDDDDEFRSAESVQRSRSYSFHSWLGTTSSHQTSAQWIAIQL